MRKSVVITGLILVPILLVLAGLYYKNQTLSSIGYVVFIFYAIMAIQGWLKGQKKKDQA